MAEPESEVLTGLETEASLAVGVTDPQSGVEALPPGLECLGHWREPRQCRPAAINGKAERSGQNITVRGRPDGHLH